MTVNTLNITSGPFTGNGVATSFAYTFRIEDKSEVTVFETDTNNVEKTLVVDTDYTVAGIGIDGGGTITRVAGALPTGFTWFIRSNFIETQDTDFDSQGGFFPDVHEKALDKLTFLIQQIIDKQSRAPVVSDSYTGPLPLLMPDPVAGKIIRWLGDLSGFENIDVSDLSPNLVTDDQLRFSFSTIADAVASTNTVIMKTSRSLDIKGRDAGIVGGGVWDLVLASTVTTNTFNIIQCVGVPTLALVYRIINNTVDIEAIGNSLFFGIQITPSSGTLQLGLTPILGKLTSVRDNISIIGHGMPYYAADGNSLENGSIIQGFFIIDGDNVHCENFGVDSGSDVCTAINGGVEMEGFICHPTVTSPVILNKNNSIRNIIGLCRLPADPVHAVLIEGLEDGWADNINGRKGQFGIVYKVSRFNIGKSTAKENGFSGVLLKSDSFAPVVSVNMVEINYFDLGAGATNSISFQANTTANMSDINVGLINVDGGEMNLNIQSSTDDTFGITRLTIDKCNLRLATVLGARTFGVCRDIYLDQMNIFDSLSGLFLNTDFRSKNVNLGDINVTASAAPTINDAVKLQGFTNYRSIITNAFNDTDNKLNLVLNTTSLGGFKCIVGDHNAILNIDLKASDLKNGWVSRASAPAGCTIKNNRVQFFGRLDPDNAGVGNEVFFTLDSWVTRNLTSALVLTCQAQFVKNADGTREVVVFVASNGDVSFPELNTVWLATGSPSGVVDLAGIVFDISTVSY